MGLLRAIGVSLILVSLTQIQYTQAKDCKITSISSPSASSLFVKWNKYVGATNYFLDLRVLNSIDIAPVVVTLSASNTQKVVHGLRPGTKYSVTVKVFQFYFVVCLDTTSAATVPATTQITLVRALSSTSILLEWARVPFSESYVVMVESKQGHHNLTVNNTSVLVTNLRPSTLYTCYINTVNDAGMGGKSMGKTISTLVQPPSSVIAEQTDKRTLSVTWQPVDGVLLYLVNVRDVYDPESKPFVANVSDTQVDIQDILPCSTYLISVSSVNDFLEPGEATDISYNTNTLNPVSSVAVDYSCTSSSTVVTWSPVFGADSYRAKAVNQNGTVLTCTSQGTQCQIEGVGCGQVYMVHVTSLSESCESTDSRTNTTFETVPCPPGNLQLYRECFSNAIIFSWQHTNNTGFYLARAIDSQGVAQDCMTEDSSCFFTSTTCGESYTFTVYSISGGCKSQISPPAQINTAPCTPKNLKTSTDCNSDSLLYEWDPADGALSYVVEAWGNQGNNSHYECSSENNSCVIKGLLCGDQLTTYITAFDDMCSSGRRLGDVGEAAVCVPQNVSATMDCSVDTVTVSWAVAPGAIFYIGTAMDANGSIHTCLSTETHCQITGLKCSTTYSTYVIASNFRCNSSESKRVAVETAPCPPDIISTSLDCAANLALISWRGPPNMLSYTATMVDAAERLLSCSTTKSSCRVSSLQCGQLYAVTVSYHDGICPSMPSRVVYMESVPCGPMDVQTSVNCTSGELTIGWNDSRHAESYAAVLTRGNGQMFSCNSTKPWCSMNTAECGQEYRVVVKSVNGTCASFPSETAIVREVPCVPTDVVAQRNCGNSIVEVTWEASRGAKHYNVISLGDDGHRSGCSSNGTTCRLEELMCSGVYNISVVAVDDSCSSQESIFTSLHTVPCPPSQLRASVDCSTNAATLSWDASPNAVAYSAKAVGADGHNVSCEETVTLACRLEGLRCGQEYVFSASASDGSCRSPDSEGMTLITAPCVPQSVVSTLDCTANTIAASWALASAPLNYSAVALDGAAGAHSCNVEGASCVVSGLQCGQQYTVSVKAINSQCEGPSSAPQTIQSIPCVPANVRGAVECFSSPTVQASWDPTPGALSYVSTLSGAQGLSASCSTADQGCAFPDLECAQEYTLTVVALGDHCNSSVSTGVPVITAPCDPENVSAILDCNSGSVNVSWEPSAGAVGYTVRAQAAGHSPVTSHVSVGISYELSLLQCGEVYTVTVAAGNGTCNSTELTSATIKTAPCPPLIQGHSLDCASNQALVSWAGDEDDLAFVVTATSTLGHSDSCSSSAVTSCVLGGLLCGHSYTVQAVALRDQCPSARSPSFEIVTAPCTPVNVESMYACGTSVARLSWDETPGREGFYVRAEAGEHTDSWSTDEPLVSLTSLLCGRLYTVTVDAVATHCNSSQSATVHLQTAPCAPQNVSASLVCSHNTASVDWLASPGAVGYNVTALGQDSNTEHCTTNDTSCDLRDMPCAQTYQITVNPFSEACKGFDSTPFSYIAGPCPPSDVRVSLQCEGNVGSVTWQLAPVADSYRATAMGEDGHTHNCTATANETSCSFTDLHCGESYAVTVVTVERGCPSEPSPPVTLKSAVCPPAEVIRMTDCGTNDIVVHWDPSPESGVTYFIHSQKEGGANTTYSTANTSYVLTGLQCGERFTVAVSTRDSVCTSTLSQAIQVDTAPCTPTNLTADCKCGTNMATITWEGGTGALDYTARVTGNHGHMDSCSSKGTSCSLKLDCGEHYSAVVIASNSACNSSSVPIWFESAPCLPAKVSATLDCGTNAFNVSWQASRGFIQGSYTAIAMGSDGSRAMCNATVATCVIDTLRCGLMYSIAVTTSTTNCSSIEGSDYHIQSAPCKPENPHVWLECSSNMAVVSWDGTGDNQVQVVSAVDDYTHDRAFSCNSSGSNCSFSHLICGRAYSLSVVGHTQQCQSEPSSTLSLLTAPCVPSYLAAEVDCDTGIIIVIWDTALGATGYTVFAQGSGGHNDTCTESDTTCAFKDLLCGQDYTMTVEARHSQCNVLASNATTVATGPCPHTGLQASLDCSSNTALVSWTHGAGILDYNASAEGLDVAHHQSCVTDGQACNISSLHCGERYRLSVRGEGRTCSSPGKEWTIITTAPCPPAQLSVEMSCEADSIPVTWHASQGSVSYVTVAESPRGHRLHCNTSATHCHISGLLCGQEYQVYAVGIDDECMGAMSNVHAIRTAPCVPQNVQNDQDCLAGTLTVTWQPSHDAHLYLASVRGSEGQEMGCETTETRCVVASMQCGLNYSVAVLARDDNCNSSISPTQHVATAPCPPEWFNTTVDCSSSVVSVTWDDGVPGVLYTALAVDSGGIRHNCSAADTGCALSALSCGTAYNVTVTPSMGACVGSSSPPQLVRTAPCVPLLKDVEMDCLSESAWVMWEESAGAESYDVMATDSQGQVQRFVCNSTDGVCAVPDMTCGRQLNFTLIASDQMCSSAPSNVVMTETAPCPPEDVRSVVGCTNRTASVSWSPSYGTLTYTATLESNDGQTTCCTTAGTSCDIADLPCGEMYVLVVTAEGRTCNSSQSAGTIARTEPCVPQSLQASLSCSSNVASVMWNHSLGGQQYRVEALSADGHSDGCRTYENNCQLSGLLCGRYYTATVVAEDRDCTSAPSASVEMKTVPCTPANISSQVDCDDNHLTVWWEDSPGADSYTATVEDGYGHATSCQALNQGHCNVTGLSCGMIYHVSVVSSDGYCDSPPSDTVDTHTVPCSASQIQAVMDCDSRMALLSWHRSNGAASYVTTVTAPSGHNITSQQHTCKTKETQCVLGGLECGQSYLVSVRALGETCSSVAEMSGALLTEPCTPSYIEVHYSLSIAQVLWDAARGTDSYTATGLTDEGLAVTCSTNDTYCALRDLACSQLYNISVTAHNAACHDTAMSTEMVAIQTEPCPPNHVQVHVDCYRAIGTVSWEMSDGAVGYVATLEARDGHTLSCHTAHTYCSVEGIHCGTVYYTQVVALGEEFNSSASTTVSLVSAPCMAEQVEVEMDCESNTAHVTWSWVDGAQSYELMATAADGQRASCHTEEDYCNMTELVCGQTYELRIAAINEQCRIETLTNASFSTRPCAPTRVGVDLQCGTSTANLYWEPRAGMEHYTATGTFSPGASSLYCNNTNSTCQFSGLRCGETYQFSVVAHNSICQSDRSDTVEIRTEPCQPVALTAYGSCGNDTLTLDWSEASGAVTYVISAMGDLGYVMDFQTNETFVEEELPCGQVYTLTVKAMDDRCESTASTPVQFNTAPCVPHHVASYTHCEDSLGSVSWAESDGAESYTAVAVGRDSQTHMCVTNTTRCTWDDLRCGDLYVVQVVSNNFLCNSAPSNSTTIRMAPCVPQDLIASLDCSTKVGSLTWNASETADVYIVTAETNSGHLVSLSINETSAQFSEFLCGEEYFLSVQAVDSVCRSASSIPARLKTVPCPPTTVSGSMDCFSNIAVVTWRASAGAEFYTATVTHDDDLAKSCLSASVECGMPNLRCGENYTITVTGSRLNCNSEPSEPSSLQSVPCVPTGVMVTMDCSDNEAAVSWNASKGALSYMVMALSSQGGMSMCESTEPGCTLTNLTCGHSYSVQVSARDSTCSSLPSRAEFNTIPCTPEVSSVVLDCATESALLEWSSAEGAVSYMAAARSASGHLATCVTNHTSCELAALQCGQTYTVTAVASNGCDGSPSASVAFISGPCIPGAVETWLDCSANTARVEWQPAAGTDSYLVQAVGMEEHMSGCQTDSSSCVVSDLMCGVTYNVSVTAVNAACNTSESAVTQLYAVPCVPNLMEPDLDCESGDVSVSWEPSDGAHSYTAVAQGNGGYASLCNSSGTTCQFDDLLCGLSYSFTVSASDDMCTSAESAVVQLNTVPCVPQMVAAEMQCSNNSALVSWEQEEGVASYLVQTVSPNGRHTDGTSTSASYQLPSLDCGQHYNLTVTALDGQCDNVNAFLSLQSVPCRPTNVRTSLQCLSNTVAVAWDHASGALSYSANAVAADGSHSAWCNDTATSCQLEMLLCGRTYNVSVFSHNEACSSTESEVAHVRTAPCPPRDVAVDIQCAASILAISWSPDPEADSFHVTVANDTGAHRSCSSNTTGCSVEELPCGQRFSVTAVMVRDGCMSAASAAVEAFSAPCVPENPKGSLDCVTDSAWVSWDSSAGALSYAVLAESGVGGHSTGCTSSSTSCNVPDLECSTVYTLHVKASNGHCQSDNSSSFQLETGPCALKNITAETECDSDRLLVGWETIEDTPPYLVTAEGHDQSFISCNSSSTSCELQGVSCGMQYTIVVSASSDKCSSLRSPPTKIHTAPCVPDGVAAVVSCEEGEVSVSWSPAAVPTSFLLTATGGAGDVRTCNTSGNNCTLAALQCGQTYAFSVTASDDNCTSPASASVSLQTVPCEPSGLSVDFQCETNSAVLSWMASSGGMEYFGRAGSKDGDVLYCDSADAACTVQGLRCGGMYNFSVEASNGICNSSFSSALLAGAAPCAPTMIDYRIWLTTGGSQWAIVSWMPVDCPDVEYVVEVTGRIHDDPQALMEVTSYWVDSLYFEFLMPCGTAFNLTVRTRNSAGKSEPSEALTGITAPCPPQDVTYNGDSQSAALSWEASVFADQYSVYNISGAGRVEICDTPELSCTITNMDPSAVEITASNAVGESTATTNITGPVANRRRRDLRDSQMSANLHKDLSVPKVLQKTVKGDSLYVEWTPVMDATEYTLIIKEEQATRPTMVVTVDKEFYMASNLQPSTSYCVILSAKNTISHSPFTKPECIHTGTPPP